MKEPRALLQAQFLKSAVRLGRLREFFVIQVRSKIWGHSQRCLALTQGRFSNRSARELQR